MRVLIVPDSFKGSFSSMEIANFIADAVLAHNPEAQIKKIPIADGGEGSIDCFLSIFPGLTTVHPSQNPIGVPIMGKIGWLKKDIAVMELAQCAGIMTMQNQLNPRIATTYGVGLQIKQAIELGAKTIYLNIGGSATNDVGVGLLSALGALFFDSTDQQFEPTPETLSRIKRIDTSRLEKQIEGIKFITLCDVTNPLTGPQGATHVFAKQKGASPETIAFLEGQVIAFEQQLNLLGVGDGNFPGAGAAGGSAVAMKYFLHSTIQSGIRTILNLIDFETLLQSTDLVITGEGKFDRQSCHGKVIDGIAFFCEKQGVQLVAIVGQMEEISPNEFPRGLTAVYPLSTNKESLEEAIQHTKERIDACINKVLIKKTP